MQHTTVAMPQIIQMINREGPTGATSAGGSSLELAAEANAHTQHDRRRKLWKEFAGDTLTAARMHTVDKTTSSTDSYDTMTSEVAAPEPSYIDAAFQRMETYSSMTMEYLYPEGGTLGAAIFGLIKGTVGPAILYLPRGFLNSGWAVAIPSMVVATVMYIFTAYRLLACWRVEHEKEVTMERGQRTHHHHHLLTYSELARRAFGSFSTLVDVGIASLQFGVCLTYLLFVPQNLVEFTEAVFGLEVDKLYFLLLMLLVEIPLGWIRDITKLTPTNVVATGLIVYGLFFVIVLAFIQGLAMADDGESRVFTQNFGTLPAFTDSWFLFVGTSFFMMEGSITLVVPLQESIAQAEDGARFPRSNQIVTTGIVIFYLVFSIICCGAFGQDIHTALTASLDGALANTIQLAYSVAVILTFPLQAFPAMQVVETNVLGVGHSNNDMQQRVLSTMVICSLGIIAYFAIDYLGNVVSILGSLFGIPLALVGPPMMHNKLIPDSAGVTRWLNYCVVGIGFVAMGAASFATIVSWDKGAEDDP